MIVKIPNQPIVFGEPDGELASCVGDESYCQLARIGDEYCFQLRQTSCLPQLLCNNNFATIGDDMIGGAGDFDDYTEAAQWTLDAAAWEFDDYQKKLCTTDDHTTGTAVFNFDPYAMSEDCNYILTFTVSGHDDEAITPADTLTIDLPDGQTVVVEDNGTYQFVTLTGGSVTFTKGNGWFGCIDNVTLKCGGVCWDISDLSAVALTGDGICKTDPDTADVTVTHNVVILEVGQYYSVEIKVSGMTQGSVEVFLGLQSVGVFDEEGTYRVGGIASGTGFYFVMSGDFDGCVKFVNLYLLTNDYTLKLKNALDDSTIIDLTTSLTYGVQTEGVKEDPELIHACIKFDEPMLGQLIPEFVKNRVCLYLELESQPSTEYTANGDFTITNNAAVEDEWFIDPAVQYNAVADVLTYKGGSGYVWHDMSGLGFLQGTDYYVSFEIKCLDHDTVMDFDSFTGTLGASNADGTGGTPIWGATDFPTGPGKYIYKVTAGTDGDSISFHFDDSTGLNKLCLDKVSVRNTACQHEIYRSNCIKYENENEGVKGWEGSKIFTACNEEGISYGFNWGTGFTLRSRLFATISNPTYQSAKDETYLQSNGVRKRVYVEVFKKMDLTVHEVDEFTHDYIRLMLKCDNLWIEEGYDLNNRYICLENEYTPEWDSKASKALAEARTEIQRVDNSLFNTNCT